MSAYYSDDDDGPNGVSVDPTYRHSNRTPAGLEPEWIEYMDSTYGVPYYYNSITGESQWEQPLVFKPMIAQDQQEPEHDATHHRAANITDSDKHVEAISHRISLNLAVNTNVSRSTEAVNTTSSASTPVTSSAAMDYSDVESGDDDTGYIKNHLNEGSYSDMDNTPRIGDESRPQSHSNRNSYLQEAAYLSYGLAPAVSRWNFNQQGVRLEPATLVGGTSLDYLGIAAQYKAQWQYRDRNAKPMCVLCRKREAQDIFFPCEHRCVCRSCIKTEKICDDMTLLSDPSGHANCSICAAVIKLILPNEGGAEVDKYWQWCYEVTPPLPPGFARRFKHAAGALLTVYSNDPNHKSASEQCSIH